MEDHPWCQAKVASQNRWSPMAKVYISVYFILLLARLEEVKMKLGKITFTCVYIGRIYKNPLLKNHLAKAFKLIACQYGAKTNL
jgi:hypothetical protein